MNNDLINTRMAPIQVITIYADSSRHDFYLEQREVVSIGGKTMLNAPVPMAEDALKEVAKSYVQKNAADVQFDGIIPEHILYAAAEPGRLDVVWYRPAMKRNLNFSAALDIPGDATVNVPATLFMITGKNLYLFALKTDGRPDRTTKLHHAPFFNIYADGRVCMGTAQIGGATRTFDGESSRYERAFFMAEQNGGHDDGCKTDLRTIWKGLIKSKKPFPAEKELIQHPTIKTLGDLIRKFAGKTLL